MNGLVYIRPGVPAESQWKKNRQFVFFKRFKKNRTCGIKPKSVNILRIASKLSFCCHQRVLLLIQRMDRKCYFCQKVFKEPSALKQHMIVHIIKRWFKCVFCSVKVTELTCPISLNTHTKNFSTMVVFTFKWARSS